MSGLSEILKTANSFLGNITYQVAGLGVKITKHELDHLAYQTNSGKQYDSLKETVAEIGTFVREGMVNGRRVGIIKLKSPLIFEDFKINAFEIIEPKPDQSCDSGFDHIEFVLNGSFQDFLNEYPQVNWDTSAMDRSEFPKITYRLPDGKSVKFHLQSILNE